MISIFQSPELTDDDDKTPIDYATEYKHYAVFDYLKSQEVAEFTSGSCMSCLYVQHA